MNDAWSEAVTFWQKHRSAVETLVAQGYSYEEIGHRIGKSRNAVAGFCYRNDIGRRDQFRKVGSR